jgi:DNA-binding MarR family transcriptional regulator
MQRTARPATTTLGGTLYAAVSDLRRELRRSVRSQFPAHPLTPSQVEVLGLVRRCPDVGVGEVAASLRLAPNTVSTIVGRLVERGLVRRDPDPDDARAIRLRLTPAGHRRVHAWRDRTARTVDAALARLSDDDRAAISHAIPALERLVDAVAESGRTDG